MRHSDIQQNGCPERRIGCSVLVTGDYDAVLLVRPVGEKYPVLPSTEVRPGERIGDAAARGLLELTGLHRVPTHSVVRARDGDEAVHFVCDAGTATSAEVFAESVPKAVWKRVDRITWMPPEYFGHELHPDTAARVRAALAARRAGHRLPLPLPPGGEADDAA